MDQQKIGVFIATCRKEQGLTQQKLAQILGISDKAVSKWETGRSMPDLSLFLPLCKVLAISVNELMLGERIEQQEWKEKADQVLMEVIKNWLGKDTRLSHKSADGKILLQIEGVSKCYDARLQAVRNVSFHVTQGSFVSIMGVSGCGKTTLLHMIATIAQPTEGSIYYQDTCINELNEKQAAAFRKQHIGFIFQEYNLLDHLNVYENIALTLTIQGVRKEAVKDMIQTLAEKLSISDILEKFPCEISGGQQQRCACARAIAGNCDLILADEPTGALDSASARQLLDIFVMLSREYHKTILMVTHDAFAASYSDEVLFMRDGTIQHKLSQGQDSKQSFFTEILDTMGSVFGGSHDLS